MNINNRIATRYKLPKSSPVIFELEKAQDVQLVIMDNISTSGVGFDAMSNDGAGFPEVGEFIVGKLRCREKFCPTYLKVIHKTESVVGCQFVDKDAGAEKFVTDEIMRQLFPSLSRD